MRRRASAAAIALLVSGCTAGKAFYAGAADFGAYRETRVAATEEARLAASAKYLRERPNGAYADEVKSDFADREQAYFAACGGDVEKLERYLDLFPDGPHAKEAASTIAAKRDREGRPDALEVAALATRDRLEGMARARERARRALLDWIDLTLDPAVFVAPLADGPLLVPFTLALPEPRCESLDPEGGVVRRCVKLLQEDFSFPRAGAFVEHAMLFDVSIEMDARGVPLAIKIAGPDLFTRLEETFIESRDAADETNRRINAIERVIEAISNVFDAKVSSDAACVKRDLVPSEVLHLACRGVEAHAIAGRDAGEDDVLRIRSNGVTSPKETEIKEGP